MRSHSACLRVRVLSGSLHAVSTWAPTPKAGKACRFLRNAGSMSFPFQVAGKNAGQEVQHHLFEFAYIEFERPSSLRMVRAVGADSSQCR